MTEKLRIAVLDDDESELARVKSALDRLGETRAEYFTAPGPLLDAARSEPPFDMALLDVFLPGGNGIETAEELRRLSPDTDLAFITTSREHAVDAFRLNAVHYLVKPVSCEDVAEALRRRASARSAGRPSFTVSINRENHRVYLDEIIFIESLRHLVEIKLTDGRCLRVWQPLAELEGMLDRSFLKINRGIIINMNEVSHMDLDSCAMSDGTSLPVKKKDRVVIRKQYGDFLMNELHIMAAARKGERK